MSLHEVEWVASSSLDFKNLTPPLNPKTFYDPKIKGEAGDRCWEPGGGNSLSWWLLAPPTGVYYLKKPK